MQNKNLKTIDKRRNEEPWYIGFVVDVNDPEKRRRLRIRGPYESEESIPTDKLQWINPFVSSKDDFQIPADGENVLVVTFGKLKLWVELPESDSFQDFSDEDYPNAYLEKHKAVQHKRFEESKGWDVLYVGDIHTKTDSYDTVQTEDDITTEISSETTKTTQDKITLETDGSSVKLTVNDVIIETDGAKISLKNGSQNLSKILDELMKALQTETHMTPAGISNVPHVTSMKKYKKIEKDLSNLLY